MEATHVETTIQRQNIDSDLDAPTIQRETLSIKTTSLETASVESVSGTLFNQRYKIEKTIGKGANSIVHFATDTQNNNSPVALKIMQFASSAERDHVQDELRRRFIQEAETATQIDHPNTIRIYDSGEFEGITYIAMEYLQGKNLRTYSYPEKLLPTETVLELLAKCAEALAYAHEKGIIHRDVKPANILYDAQSETVKLTDFGIAKISDSTQTLEGSFLGTPLYMSPEQLAGKSLDASSDIFSLGATAFRLLSGHPPFPGTTLGELMRAITSQPHQDLQQLCPMLPSALISVVDRALAKDPSERYQDGYEMAAALRACAPLLTQSDCA